MVRALQRASPRDRIDIIATILAIANGGATRRQILLSSGISTEQFKRYLFLLQKTGYIETEEHDNNGYRRIKIYRTTDKGIALLDPYYNIRELLVQTD
ncbi:MAG: winged helix-turn-helix domain-containing protein [Thermoproteota archaeon]